jgi:voltage-dependent calcium channel
MVDDLSTSAVLQSHPRGAENEAIISNVQSSNLFLLFAHLAIHQLAVFGNLYGLLNMSLFLILVNYIAALVALQLVHGDIPSGRPMDFGWWWTGFLAVWQIFSSENWTDVLYGAMTAEKGLGQVVIVAIFLSCWLLFANCKYPLFPDFDQFPDLRLVIILQMFIAVINENFDVAEELKKDKQAVNYFATYQPQTAKFTWMRRLNPYRWVRPNPVTVKVENLPSNLVLQIQQSLVQDYRVPRQDGPSVSVSVVSVLGREIS